MRFEKFYITDENGNSNCVIRSISKALNESYSDVYDGINKISKESHRDFNDIFVFETYMKNNDINKIDYGKNQKIKDLKLDDNTYVIFCWDKKDFYHMITIINNTVYDRTDESLNLYVISIYKYH